MQDDGSTGVRPLAADNRELFVLAEDALNSVVQQIRDGQWQRPIPEWFHGFDASGQTLRSILNYHLYDDRWVPDTLAGKTIAEVGATYDGDLLDIAPKRRFQEAVQAAKQAAATSDQSKLVHLTYGEVPAHEFLLHTACFRSFRAVDIARLIGVNDQLPPKLVELLHERLLPRIEEFRSIGIFRPARPIPAQADRQAELLALAGYAPEA